MPQDTIHDALHQPFQADWIDEWDGAFTKEHRDASLWLFEAVVSRNPNLVTGMVRAGARVNTRLKDNVVHARLHDRTPLAIALWMVSHAVTDRSRGAISDGKVRTDLGVVAALLAAGATPMSSLRGYLDGETWEDSQHPVFRALEDANLDLLATNDPMRRLSHDDRRQAIERGWTFHTSSVVPEHPEHNAHLWLHRAILRHRWDAVDAWFRDDGVLGVADGDSATAMLWDLLMRTHRPEGGRPGKRNRPSLAAPAPVSSERTLRRALGQVRTALMKEDDEVYRQELLMTLGLALRHERSSTHPVIVSECLAWVDALLMKRPFRTFTLNEEEWAGFRTMRAHEAGRVRHHLIGVEGRLMHATLPRSGDDAAQASQASGSTAVPRRRL